jgi:hypothetical protein
MPISSARDLSLVVPDTQTEKQFVLLAVQLAVKKYREAHPLSKQDNTAFPQGESAVAANTPE